jgi:hypothetical protein
VILATVTVGMLLRKCSIVNREMVLKALRAYGSQVYNSLFNHHTGEGRYPEGGGIRLVEGLRKDSVRPEPVEGPKRRSRLEGFTTNGIH